MSKSKVFTQRPKDSKKFFLKTFQQNVTLDTQSAKCVQNLPNHSSSLFGNVAEFTRNFLTFGKNSP